jgi:hypothetical protein
MSPYLKVTAPKAENVPKPKKYEAIHFHKEKERKKKINK